MKDSNGKIEKLNRYLQVEVAACETYKQAAERAHDDVVREQLLSCEASHRRRAHMLRTCIEDMGARPIAGQGVWNSFASLLAQELFDDRDAVQKLEVEEELGLKEYNEEIDGGDPQVRELFEQTLIPEQATTHDALSILRLSLQ